MGGLMPYQRMRSRNGLMYRKPDDDPDPYWRGDAPGKPPDGSNWILIGDMNRMERDYLTEGDPGGGLAGQVARTVGVPEDDVRKVLRYVFMEQP